MNSVELKDTVKIFSRKMLEGKIQCGIFYIDPNDNCSVFLSNLNGEEALHLIERILKRFPAIDENVLIELLKTLK